MGRQNKNNETRIKRLNLCDFKNKMKSDERTVSFIDIGYCPKLSHYWRGNESVTIWQLYMNFCKCIYRISLGLGLDIIFFNDQLCTCIFYPQPWRGDRKHSSWIKKSYPTLNHRRFWYFTIVFLFQTFQTMFKAKQRTQRQVLHMVRIKVYFYTYSGLTLNENSTL